MTFLNSRAAQILTGVLVLQAAAYYGISARSELAPAIKPLSSFPQESNGWRTVQESPLDKPTLDVLKADDTLNREYVDAAGTRGAFLLFEFFKTQRYGVSPHSPKNCLPGAGWEPIETGKLAIPVAGRDTPIVTNKYVVAHGEEKSLVLYWYQSHNRVIASEYSAKFWLVVDAIRYRRSDTSMVRVVVPIRNDNVAAATQTGVEFVQALFPDIAKQLPS
jgi:EpsI family protein